MKNTTNNIILFAACTLGILVSIACLNYFVDPMCYYQCSTVDLSRRTENVYYQAAQTAAANPDAEIIILGSSRGETTPPKWLQEVTGMKTVNLSQGGADLLLKVAVLNTSLEFGAQLKKVLWIADYFELSSSASDIKVKITPVLSKYGLIENSSFYWSSLLSRTQRLIDHKSFNATLSYFKDDAGSHYRPSGNGSEIDYINCQSPEFKGATDPALMAKEIHGVYGNFSNALRAQQSPEYWQLFEKQLKTLESRGIEVILFIPPYHPEFMFRFNKEYPEASLNLRRWRDRLTSLASAKVKILDYFEGVPGDDGGPSYWNDGVHMTCKSIIAMLKLHFKNEPGVK